MKDHSSLTFEWPVTRHCARARSAIMVRQTEGLCARAISWATSRYSRRSWSFRHQASTSNPRFLRTMGRAIFRRGAEGLSTDLATFALVKHIPTRGEIRHDERARRDGRRETQLQRPMERLQLCLIPCETPYEPNYETGKPVRWRIGMASASRSRSRDFGARGKSGGPVSFRSPCSQSMPTSTR